MCGIYASISTSGFLSPSRGLRHLLCNRGPDHVGEAQVELVIAGETFSFSFTSTVLALRGDHVQVQPFVDAESGSILCWNGEAWRIDSEPVAGNDARRVFEALLQATSESISKSTAAVLQVLRSISGPFAMVFLDKIRHRIYIARDRLGRRSLLYNVESLPNHILFASTSDPGSHSWKELEADGIYRLSFSDESGFQDVDDRLSTQILFPAERYPWVSGHGLSSVSSPFLHFQTFAQAHYPSTELE